MSWVQTLVVVGALAAVVPQVERGLDGRADVLVAARVLGMVARRAPVRVHVVHLSVSCVSCLIRVGWWPRTPRDGDGPTRGSHEGGALLRADHAGCSEESAAR